VFDLTSMSSCEAIRQDEAQAMRELRKPKNYKRLRPFLPENEQIYSMGLVGNGVDRFNRTWTSTTERAVIAREELTERLEEHKRWLEELRRSQQAGRKEVLHCKEYLFNEYPRSPLMASSQY